MDIKSLYVVVDRVDGEGHFQRDLAFGVSGEEIIERLAEARGESGGAGDALGGIFGAVHPVEGTVEGVDERSFARGEAGGIADGAEGAEDEGVAAVGAAMDGEEAVVDICRASKRFDVR
jgi:hypothetical protein